jgi:hypothetical protein
MVTLASFAMIRIAPMPRSHLRPKTIALALLPLALAGSVVGCASGPEDPEGVLHAYARALSDGRAEDAYRMLSDDAKRGISLDAFRRMLQGNKEDVKEVSLSLSRPTSPPLVTATLTTPSGQEIDLVLENGRWRIEATAIDLYAQDTPRHAVQGFVRALERKRYDMVLKYVPDAHKEGLDEAKLKAAWEGYDKEEMTAVLAALKQALPGASIEEVGDSAQMPYGSGVMRFVREHGLWKIEDFD